MKIVLVSSNYLPFLGGVEVHVQHLAKALARQHDVTIAAMNFAACKWPWSLAVLHANLLAPSASDGVDGAIPVCSLAPTLFERIAMLPLALRAAPKLRRWFYHRINALTYPFYRAAILPKLRRLFRGVDVVHGLVHGDIGWAAEDAARAENCAYVCTPFVHPHQWGDGPIDVAYYQRCDAVIGLVETDRAYLESLGVSASRLHVIGVSPNLPPTADGAAFRRRHGLEGVPLVLYVGRMMAQKGAAAILGATPLVWQRHPDVRFVFVGPALGSEAQIFDGADPRIRYLGRVDAQEKADAIDACDIFCMPSTSEILPTVYLEAWSLGKPVIGGQAHGLRELVEGNCAGLVSDQRAEPLAAALLRFLDQPSFRAESGEAGLRLVASEFSVEAVVGKIEAVYRRVHLSRSAAPGTCEPATVAS